MVRVFILNARSRYQLYDENEICTSCHKKMNLCKLSV